MSTAEGSRPTVVPGQRDVQGGRAGLGCADHEELGKRHITSVR